MISVLCTYPFSGVECDLKARNARVSACGRRVFLNIVCRINGCESKYTVTIDVSVIVGAAAGGR